MEFPFGAKDAPDLDTSQNPFEVQSDVMILVLTGPDAGTSIELPPEGAEIGASATATVHLSDEAIVDNHARFLRLANGRFRVENLAGEGGVRVDDEDVDLRELRDGECIRITPDTLMRIRYRDHGEIENLDRFHEALIRDPLTGIANRPYFLRRLDQEFGFARRHGTALSLLMIDIDGLRKVNEEHGESAGDEVVYNMAHALSNVVRVEDLVARYGDDEFVVFSRGYDAPDGERFADRLCSAMRERPVTAGGKEFHLNLSIGVAGFPSCTPLNSMDLVARADAALHAAKTAGGGRVSVWSDPLVDDFEPPVLSEVPEAAEVLDDADFDNGLESAQPVDLDDDPEATLI